MSGMISIFSSIILLATVSTLAIALFAYAAYKVRERRKPEAPLNEAITKTGTFRAIFLRRYLPGEGASPAAGGGASGSEESALHREAKE